MNQNADQMLPLKAADFQILLVLLDGCLHGYGIMKEVERSSDGSVRLELGSLYRVLARLLASGLVEDVESTSETPRALRERRHYRISDLGRRVAAAEAQRLVRVVEQSQVRSLLTRKRRA